MSNPQSEESDSLRSVLRSLGEYRVLGLRQERFREDFLDISLTRKMEHLILRFWSPRNLEIHRDDEDPWFIVLVDDEPPGGGLRVTSPEGARSTLRFDARAVERFKRWPTAWDMYIDAVAGLCLWAWRTPFTHYGVMHQEVGLPPKLARRLDRWIKSKYEGTRSALELDARGRELAPLVLPYLGPEVILYLYLEAEERYERINAPAEGL